MTRTTTARFVLVLSICLVGVLCFVVATRSWSPWLGWCATFVLGLALPWLWRDQRVRPVKEQFRRIWDQDAVQRWLPYGLVTLVLVVAIWPVSRGVVPISQDHGNHYLATHIFVYDMVAQGQLFGWTDRIGIGVPFGDVYGTLAYLVTGALTLLSFGLIPLSVSYAFGIFLVWWIPAMAVVAWARRLGVGVIPPVVAGCLFVLDAGGDREGGWTYSMFHGVWPQLLATGVWLWALLGLVRLVERQTWRRLGAASLLVGLALWAHPMNLINLVLASMLLIVLFLLDEASATTGHTQRGALWCLVALAVGGAIGSLWLIHLFVAAPYLGEYTAYWRSLPTLMLQMLNGHLFDNQIILSGVLAVFGVVGVWRQHTRLGLFALVLCAGFLLVGSMDLLALFDLGLHPGHRLFMFRRLAVSIKPFWFIFAGIGAALLLKGLRSVSAERAVRWPAKLLLALVMAPLVWSTAMALPRLVKSPAMRTLTADKAGLTIHLQRIRRVMQQERKRFPDRRLRLIQWRRGTGSYSLFLVADEGWSYFPVSTPPCQAFVWGNSRPNFAMMKWFGATHLISYGPQTFPGLQLLLRSNRYFLYRIVPTKSSRPVRLEGSGQVEVLAWEPTRRRLRVSGVNAQSRLILGLPPYHKWRVRQGERTLPLQLYRLQDYDLSQITGLSDGVVELTYQHKSIESIFAWLGGLSLLLVLIWLSLGQRQLPALLTARWLRWLGRVTGWAVVLGLVGGLVVLFVLQKVALHLEYAEPKYPRVLQALHRSGLTSYTYGPRPYCIRPFDRNARPWCDEAALSPRLLPGPRRWDRVPLNPRVIPGAENYARLHLWAHRKHGVRSWQRIPSCLFFGVPGRGKAVLRFRLPPQTRLLKGRFHWAHKRMGRTLLINGAPHKLKTTKRFRIAVPANTQTIMLVLHNHLRTRNTCLELVALGR